MYVDFNFMMKVEAEFMMFCLHAIFMYTTLCRLWKKLVLPVPSCVLWEHQRGHLPSDRTNGGPGAAAPVGNSEGAQY